MAKSKLSLQEQANKLLDEAYVKHIGYKMIGLPSWAQLYCLVPILKGMVPAWVYKKVHQMKYN